MSILKNILGFSLNFYIGVILIIIGLIVRVDFKISMQNEH